MDIQHLTFGLKDVLAIITGTGAVLGVYYTLKAAVERVKNKAEGTADDLKLHIKATEERFLHAKNSKKANIEMIMETIAQTKVEMDKKETQIYNRIGEIREEQKNAHDKMWQKLEAVATMQQEMNATLAELRGYFKGKQA